MPAVAVDPAAPRIEHWDLISSSDNWVYQHGSQVFKTAKPGRAERVLNGYRTALRLGHLGRVHKPTGDMVEIEGHLGSLWSYLDGEPTIESAFKAFRWLSDQNLVFGDIHFDPMTKILQRVNNTEPELRSLFSPYLAKLEAHLPTIADIPLVSQHGDGSFDNCIDGVLIDFDSAGLHPQGWDRACLHYSTLYHSLDERNDLWPLDDQTRALTPIKWAVSVSWNLEAGRIPPSWEARNQLAWST